MLTSNDGTGSDVLHDVPESRFVNNNNEAVDGQHEEGDYEEKSGSSSEDHDSNSTSEGQKRKRIRRSFLSAEQRQHVIDLYKDGVTPHEIVKQTQLGERNVYYIVSRFKNSGEEAAVSLKRNKYSCDEQARMMLAWSEGGSIAEIARVLNIPLRTVRNIIERNQNTSAFSDAECLEVLKWKEESGKTNRQILALLKLPEPTTTVIVAALIRRAKNIRKHQERLKLEAESSSNKRRLKRDSDQTVANNSQGSPKDGQDFKTLSSLDLIAAIAFQEHQRIDTPEKDSKI